MQEDLEHNRRSKCSQVYSKRNSSHMQKTRIKSVHLTDRETPPRSHQRSTLTETRLHIHCRSLGGGLPLGYCMLLPICRAARLPS